MGFEKWSKWTVKERVKPLLKLRQILEEKEDELAELIMLEHGKNRVEALGSIRKGNETVQYVKFHAYKTYKSPINHLIKIHHTYPGMWHAQYHRR